MTTDRAATSLVRTGEVAAPPAGATPVRRAFLPEIQALRALAVGLVVVYHVRPDLLPGGFVGVDVFFVISGFLISGHLLREVTATGRVSLAAFWAARVRRILPASLVVIAVVLLTCTWVLPPSEWTLVQRHGWASLLYVENWVLAAGSVDYLAADDVATPFQHFWSLAVEEQFYLVWPLLFVAAGALAARGPRRRRPVPVRRVLLVVLGLVVVASFVESAVRVGGGDPAAYFATTARVWELGIGGLLALAPRPTGRATSRALLALAGLGTIVAAAFLLSGADPFPGPHALWPVLGTCAVIVAGRTAGPLSLHRLVDARPVQWLGATSYSVYLWHFPVVVYAATWTGREPTALEAVAMVGAALVLGRLSHRYVEQPFRRRRLPDGVTLRRAVVAMAVVALLSLVVTLRVALADDVTVPVAPGSGYGAEAVQDGGLPTFVGPHRALAPALTSVVDDEVSAFDEDACSARGDGPVSPPTTCSFGPADAAFTLALVGDSHARMVGSPVLAIAAQHGWRVDTYLRDSCPFSTEMRTIDQGPDCVAANEATLRAVLDDPPDAVLTVAYGASRFRETEGPDRPGVRGFARTWNVLEDAGVDVLVLKDAPQPDPSVVRCVTSHPENPRRCALDRDTALKGRDVVDDAALLAPRAEVIDLTEYFCGPEVCPPVIGNVVVYRDTNHLTDTYARSLTTVLGERIVPER
ncbi:acyltransferase family protein [Isoptericola dokdonensis]|uniref:O-acetyltransferase OatA n=1 Tax=Isoptericola dokdonensis DS-3 TaxID=1300344 RepID=A0A161I157_9MICO|nr:acyltransferase family protein [Isoptericola dokdonensis]ANC32833.1 O-acetyltransferase OatA [Isoptericola dokdonensis DS-3]